MEFDISARGADLVDLIRDLAQLKPYSMSADTHGVVVIFRQVSSDIFPVDRVMSTLERYGIRAVLQQAQCRPA